LHERGEIYPADYDGWYCVTCERFFTEKDIHEGRCPQCERAVQRIREKNWFFRMSRHQEWLIRYIEEHPAFIQPDFRRNETLGFLRKPLQDLCIARPKSRLAWGIELPFDKDYVCYVWFDALVNYISAAGYGSDDVLFRRRWPATYHLIGKDILTTHTVYWPIMLRALDLPQPETIFAHGWWLAGQTKMSKSLGNAVNPLDFLDRYGADAFRYFVLAEMAPGQDAGFTEDAFTRRYNADLANDLGNLLSRLAKMVGAYAAGRLPAPETTTAPAAGPEGDAWSAAQQAARDADGAFAELRTDLAIAAAIAAVRAANRYLEIKQPWTLAKQGAAAAVGTTLYTAAECLRVAAGLLYPVMPVKIAALYAALGLGDAPPANDDLRRWGVLPVGSPVAPPESLFPRIERVVAPEPLAPPSPPPAAAPKPVHSAPAASPAEGLITLDDVMKVDLRTAVVVSAEKVAGADKLLKLEIDVGGERRPLVAGIALHYAPETLVGKTVIVVANLKPAKIRGVESRGMLLAASAGGQLRLLTTDGELPSGARAR